MILPLNSKRCWRERLAVLTIFFCAGAVMASWVSRIPTVQQRLHLSAGVLGLCLLGLAMGSLLAMPLTGWLIERGGSRRSVFGGLILMSLALPLPSIAPTPVALAGALMLLGMGIASADVAINAAAVTVERRWEKSLMSSFHAMWSVGGMLGAAAGAALALQGVTALAHLTGAALLLGGLGGWTAAGLPSWDQEDMGMEKKTPLFVLPPRVLLGLSAITFGAFLAEGAMADWSAVYLHRDLHLNPGDAAIGFAVFSLAMALGRLSGDALIQHWGPVRIVRASSFLAAIALGVALVINHPVAIFVGLALVGAGLSVIIPVAFSAAGNTSGIAPSRALAAVVTTGYFGFLVGPPLIGFTAEIGTLRGALGIVAGLCLGITFLSGCLKRPLRRNVTGQEGFDSSLPARL